MGNPNPKIWTRNFIYPIEHIKKFAKFTVELFFFKTDQNGGDIARRLGATAALGKRKALNCSTITTCVYDRSPRSRC